MSLEELIKLNKYVAQHTNFNKSDTNRWVQISDPSFYYYGQVDIKETESGFGVLDYPETHRAIVGEFNLGMPNGRAMLYDTYYNRVISFNTYVNGVFEGYGYVNEITGMKYTGFFSNGTKNGLGKTIIKNVMNKDNQVIFDEIQQFGIFKDNEMNGPAIVFLIKNAKVIIKSVYFVSNNKREGFTLDSSLKNKIEQMFNCLDNVITKDGKEYKEMENFLNDTYNNCINNNMQKDSDIAKNKREQDKRKYDEQKKEQDDLKKKMLQEGKGKLEANQEVNITRINDFYVRQYANMAFNLAKEFASCACNAIGCSGEDKADANCQCSII